MQKSVAEILKYVEKLPTNDEKIEALREQNNNDVLKLLLKMSFDPGLRWRIPEGSPPYQPSPDFDQQGMLYKEVRRLYLFIDHPESQTLPQIKREKLFIDLLEALHPDDAKLLINVKDKKPLAEGITKDIVSAAFPGLLQ